MQSSLGRCHAHFSFAGDESSGIDVFLLGIDVAIGKSGMERSSLPTVLFVHRYESMDEWRNYQMMR